MPFFRNGFSYDDIQSLDVLEFDAMQEAIEAYEKQQEYNFIQNLPYADFRIFKNGHKLWNSKLKGLAKTINHLLGIEEKRSRISEFFGRGGFRRKKKE